jgi:predicted GNAT superfamily acetyltransferase
MDILEGKLETVTALSRQIPELKDPDPIEEYQKRLPNTADLVLAAFRDEQAVRFKKGSERDAYFHSWMRGVLPAFRQRGVARALAEYQEKRTKNKGHTTIVFKTRNYLKGMLIFALQNVF